MLKRIIKAGIIFLIKVYQKIISPFTLPSCRYKPTCSTYAIEAFKKYSIWKGFFLAIKRITSCNPWGGNGYDPVP